MNTVQKLIAVSVLCGGLYTAAAHAGSDGGPCISDDYASKGFGNSVISADFDGDGIEDRACHRDKYEDGSIKQITIEFGPFIDSAYPSERVVLEEYDSTSDLNSTKLLFDIMEPGRYTSLCNRGIGMGDSCPDGEESLVYTNNPSLMVAVPEKTAWMYVLADKDTRTFRQFYLTD